MIDLYPYQTKYLADMPQRGIMHAGLGTGKTLMSLQHYRTHASHLPLLIIAPASKTRTGDWEEEIERLFGKHDQPEYTLISRERFTTSKYQGRPRWWDFVPKFGGRQHAVIVDEIHIGGRNASGSFHRKLMYATKDATFFVGLSGTPLPNGWKDYMGYALLFGYARNQTEFKKRYFDIATYKGYPEIVAIRNEDELQAQWDQISRYLDRSQANELPARQFIPVDSPRPDAYTKMLHSRMDGDELLDSPSKLLHHLRQTLTTHKFDGLSNILNDTDENVLIFYNYDSERQALLKRLQDAHADKTVFEINGHVKSQPKRVRWATLRNSVTLCHYKSASAGLELTYATVTIYFSPTYSYAEYTQSIGRTHRNGQTKKCLYYNFRTKDTVEVDVYKALKGKSDFTAKIFEKTIDNTIETVYTAKQGKEH